MQTLTLKVLEKRRETVDTVTLCFKQPGLRKVRYLAGQYLTLIFRINGRRYLRPYSFSSAPDVDQFLEVTVKRVQGGIVSNHIHDITNVGDVIEALEPLGDFVVTDKFKHADHNLILWAAGSGITPLFSIIKSTLKNKPNQHITLIYGNRAFDSVIFMDKLHALQELYPNKLKIWHFHTQPSINGDYPDVVQGRIEPGMVLSVMRDECEVTNSLHYICGPAGLKESVKTTLQKYDIPGDNIFSEDFELLKNEQDFEGVATQYVEVICDAGKETYEVPRGKSILEAGLEAGVELPYSCQTGNCSICKGKLLNGIVKQIIKRHADLLENEYQLCCTYPLSADVQIEV